MPTKLSSRNKFMNEGIPSVNIEAEEGLPRETSLAVDDQEQNEYLPGVFEIMTPQAREMMRELDLHHASGDLDTSREILEQASDAFLAKKASAFYLVEKAEEAILTAFLAYSKRKERESSAVKIGVKDGYLILSVAGKDVYTSKWGTGYTTTAPFCPSQLDAALHGHKPNSFEQKDYAGQGFSGLQMHWRDSNYRDINIGGNIVNVLVSGRLHENGNEDYAEIHCQSTEDAKNVYNYLIENQFTKDEQERLDQDRKRQEVELKLGKLRGELDRISEYNGQYPLRVGLFSRAISDFIEVRSSKTEVDLRFRRDFDRLDDLIQAFHKEIEITRIFDQCLRILPRHILANPIVQSKVLDLKEFIDGINCTYIERSPLTPELNSFVFKLKNILSRQDQNIRNDLINTLMEF